MTYQPTDILSDRTSLPKLPGWVTSGAKTSANVAFRSGAALTVLDALATDPRHAVPAKLLANRLALRAATATSKLEGRMAREADIRDAFHLTPPGEARGPDGDGLAYWRDAAQLRLNGGDWTTGLRELVGQNFADDILGWLNAGADRAKTHGPLAGCTFVLRVVLDADDRAERIACLLSDIVFARTMGWPSLLPITAQHVNKTMLRDLVADGQGADLIVQLSLFEAIEDAIRRAHDLTVRAAALRAVAPKLRAKGSDAAVAVFLSEDVVAPSSMLSPLVQGSNTPMTDRAARRFCDRLVELGVARELTGRATFRLYGIAE